MKDLKNLTDFLNNLLSEIYLFPLHSVHYPVSNRIMQIERCVNSVTEVLHGCRELVECVTEK